LEVNSDLVHATSARLAEDDRSFAVVGETLKFGATVFAFGRDAADANLVADHLDGLVAHQCLAAAFGKRPLVIEK